MRIAKQICHSASLVDGVFQYDVPFDKSWIVNTPTNIQFIVACTLDLKLDEEEEEAGQIEIILKVSSPDGKPLFSEAAILKFRFEGEKEVSIHHIFSIDLAVESVGTYWTKLIFEDECVEKAPIHIMYNPTLSN